MLNPFAGSSDVERILCARLDAKEDEAEYV